jgi:hypothetical protein
MMQYNGISVREEEWLDFCHLRLLHNMALEGGELPDGPFLCLEGALLRGFSALGLTRPRAIEMSTLPRQWISLARIRILGVHFF